MSKNGAKKDDDSVRGNLKEHRWRILRRIKKHHMRQTEGRGWAMGISIRISEVATEAEVRDEYPEVK